jgi:hypothetical protein
MHKYEDKNRGFKTEGEEVFVFVERNQIKYSVSQNRTLLKVSYVSRTSNVLWPPLNYTD